MCGWIIRISGGSMGATAVNIVAICTAVAASAVAVYRAGAPQGGPDGQGVVTKAEARAATIAAVMSTSETG
jgi:hypothetical protein